MCFAACGGAAQDDRWFQAAYDSDLQYLQQQRKKCATRRDLRFAYEGVYPGFTAFLYAVYQNNVDAMAVLLPQEMTLPSLEPVVLKEDKKVQFEREVVAEHPSAEPGQKKKIFKKRPEDPGPEYNYREFPANSTSLELAVHCSNWDAFNLMMESIRFQPDEFQQLMHYKNEHREMLLHFFVRNGSDRALSELIKTGRQFIVQNLDAESDMGVNPVVLSIRMGKIKFLEYFLGLGYDDECLQKLSFCLRKQKNKPAVEELCTPSYMFNTTEEDAYQAAFLLAAFRRRSFPPPPEWLVREMSEKILEVQRRELEQFEEHKEEGPIPPWLKRQREAGIASGSSVGDAMNVPYVGLTLERFQQEMQKKLDGEEGLMHVYDQLAAPPEAKVGVYAGDAAGVQPAEAVEEQPEQQEGQTAGVQDL